LASTAFQSTFAIQAYGSSTDRPCREIFVSSLLGEAGGSRERTVRAEQSISGFGGRGDKARVADLVMCGVLFGLLLKAECVKRILLNLSC
jgi:hypothetical protein